MRNTKAVEFGDHAWAVRHLVVDAGAWLLSREVPISDCNQMPSLWSALGLGQPGA